jgi:hypothetical protein
MSRHEEISLHAGRALEELDCARNAACDAAAHAHLALSELHLGRMRELSLVRERTAPLLRLVG